MGNPTRQKIVSIVLAAGFALSAQACSTAKRGATDERSASELQGPPLPVGPLPTEGEGYGPETPREQGIVLVLGPGGTKEFAHSGVLSTLSESGVKINAIVATNLGAVISVLFAKAKSPHAYEWALQQWKSDPYEAQGGIASIFSNKNNKKKLDKQLVELVGDAALEGGAAPVFVYSMKEKRKGEWSSHGEAAPVLVDELMLPWEAGEIVLHRGAFFPIAEAKALGMGPIVVVDVLGGLTDVTALPENETERTYLEAYRRAWASGAGEATDAPDYWIRPQVSAVGFSEFARRAEAVFAGKKAARGVASEIKRRWGSG